MKVTPNYTMVAPQDDLDLHLVSSRITRFLTNVVEKLSSYKRVDHTNRHAMKQEESNTEACLIINLNGKTRIVADIKKSGLYYDTPTNKRTSQNGNCKAAKSNGKNTRSPAKKKTNPARQIKQETTNFNFVNNCPDCKFAQKEYKLTNNQCFDCGILEQQAKAQKKSPTKTHLQAKIAQNAITNNFQKLTSAGKTHQKQSESFDSNLSLNADAICVQEKGKDKWEDDGR
jgi:nitrate reductase cytochrome c-type subunit